MERSEYLVLGCEKARAHPVIARFAQLEEEARTGVVLEFIDLQSRQFQDLWKHFIIYRFLEAEDEFQVVFFGTYLVDIHGTDWTGKRLSELGLSEDAAEAIRDLNRKTLSNGNRQYNSGKINCDVSSYKIWRQARQPLARHGRVNEVLVCMCFDGFGIEY